MAFALARELWNDYDTSLLNFRNAALVSVMNQSSHRILICRLSHIGDCILTLPLLSAIRSAFPGAFIAWAVEKPTEQLLSQHPDLDCVINIERRWLRSVHSIRSMRHRLRKFRFNIAIDPQSITKSSLLAYVSGARHRVGFGGRHGRELSKFLNNRLITCQTTHLVDRTLELLPALGVHPRSVKFRLPIQSLALQDVDRFLLERGISNPIAVINPGASWPSKQWEDDRFAEVAAYLVRQIKRDCVVTWAGDRELAQAHKIVACAGNHVHLAPPTNLQQLAALLHRSEMFVGCDTGPMHLAAAVDTLCVGLYGPTRPQDSGAYGGQHVAVQQWYQSGSCRKRRSATNDAMRDISARQVCDACDMAIQLLEQARNMERLSKVVDEQRDRPAA